MNFYFLAHFNHFSKIYADVTTLLDKMFQEAVAILSGRLLPPLESFAKNKDIDLLHTRVERITWVYGLDGVSVPGLLSEKLFDSITDQLGQLSSLSRMEYWKQLHGLTATFSHERGHSVLTQDVNVSLARAMVTIFACSQQLTFDFILSMLTVLA